MNLKPRPTNRPLFYLTDEDISKANEELKNLDNDSILGSVITIIQQDKRSIASMCFSLYREIDEKNKTISQLKHKLKVERGL